MTAIFELFEPIPLVKSLSDDSKNTLHVKCHHLELELYILVKSLSDDSNITPIVSSFKQKNRVILKIPIYDDIIYEFR